jgi:hypothetical protein
MNMNPMNEILRAALNKATAALFSINDAGATATEISIQGGRPLIQLDGPPQETIKGVLRKSYPSGDSRECVMVAVVNGCQVEWKVRTLRGTAARAGA